MLCNAYQCLDQLPDGPAMDAASGEGTARSRRVLKSACKAMEKQTALTIMALILMGPVLDTRAAVAAFTICTVHSLSPLVDSMM